MLLALLISASTLPAAPNHFVLDETGVLSPVEKSKLENLALEIKQAGNGEIGVILTDDLRGRADRNEFANDLFKAWGIGHKGKDDGVLIVAKVHPPDRGVKVEIGYGLEGRLNDGKVASYIRGYVPLFKANRWGNGLFALTSALANEMVVEHKEMQPATLTQPVSTEAHSLVPLFVLIGFFIVVGLGILIFWLLGRKEDENQDFSRNSTPYVPYEPSFPTASTRTRSAYSSPVRDEYPSSSGSSSSSSSSSSSDDSYSSSSSSDSSSDWGGGGFDGGSSGGGGGDVGF